MEINPILNVLKAIFPHFKLEESEIDKFLEKTRQANYLNLYIHFEKGENNTPIVYLTLRGSHLEKTIPKNSFIVTSSLENDQKLNIQHAPFSFQTNIMIDHSSFWKSRQEIKLRGLKIIPIVPEELALIETMEIPHAQIFKVKLKTDGQLNVNIGVGDEEMEIDISSPTIPQIIFHKNCNWTFQKYLPNQIIEFDSIPEIVISFDKIIVRESILIKREHNIRPDEYYVLVVSN